MENIKAHNPLRTLVSACGQVQLRSAEIGREVRSSCNINVPNSVGSVLLVVRNGKSEVEGLDDLSYRLAAHQADREVGLT
jgi:hypothetical protein